MMRHRVGGNRKSWRLRKKYRKWFRHCLRDLIQSTLSQMSDENIVIFEQTQGYEFTRLYAREKTNESNQVQTDSPDDQQTTDA